jgi:hypothetical protein
VGWCVIPTGCPGGAGRCCITVAKMCTGGHRSWSPRPDGGTAASGRLRCRAAPWRPAVTSGGRAFRRSRGSRAIPLTESSRPALSHSGRETAGRRWPAWSARSLRCPVMLGCYRHPCTAGGRHRPGPGSRRALSAWAATSPEPRPRQAGHGGPHSPLTSRRQNDTAPHSTATGAFPVSAPAGGRRSPRCICRCRARPIPADFRPAGSASLFLRAAAHRGRATAHRRRSGRYRGP